MNNTNNIELNNIAKKVLKQANVPEDQKFGSIIAILMMISIILTVIRILQEDVYKDKYDWLTELCENIEKITNDNIVQNIYMCKNNEYKDFDL